ncbi:MAG: CHASE2 domain-containing protein [Nitrospinae bacterium]|nr:CHASE2 domain-containing protein [Nitrospinota bacterium]
MLGSDHHPPETADAMPPRFVPLLIALAATLLVTVALRSGPGEGLSLKGLDLLYALHADKSDADPRIVMVEVDQASLDHFAKDNIPFPWPRSLYNPVLAFVTEGGAKSVSFDILFDTDTVFGAEVDASFAEAIAKAGNVTLAAALYDGTKADAAPLPDRLTLPTEGVAPAPLRMGRVAPPLSPFVGAASVR